MNNEVEKGRALDEAESLQVVNALVKQRRDSVEQFRGGRPDRTWPTRNRPRSCFFERYLPPAADAAAIAAAIEAAVAETGAAGPKDMGKVMKAVMVEAGRACRSTAGPSARPSKRRLARSC